jgi:hypothetical protein
MCPGWCISAGERTGDLSDMPDLERLAELIQIKNNADAAIAELIGRPSAPGNIGEFVAARVFAIQLMTSGSHPGYDGKFTNGLLAGKTVNIKTYSRHQSVLDISAHPCDYYLVLTGPAGAHPALGHRLRVPVPARGAAVSALTARGIKIGVATSVRKADCEAAWIFPRPQAPRLQLTESQLAQLTLFSSQAARVR